MRKQRIIIAIVICAMLLTSGTFCDFVTVMASTGQIASGKCGDNLVWSLDSNGTLTISGTGKWIIGYGIQDQETWKEIDHYGVAGGGIRS